MSSQACRCLIAWALTYIRGGARSYVFWQGFEDDLISEASSGVAGSKIKMPFADSEHAPVAMSVECSMALRAFSDPGRAASRECLPRNSVLPRGRRDAEDSIEFAVAAACFVGLYPRVR